MVITVGRLVRASMVLAALLLPGAAGAGVLDRVAESGVLAAGTRADAVPFAFTGPDGSPAGFSVDLLEQIRAAAAARLGRPVELKLQTVTTKDRLERIASGELDIVCEITTPTWAREKTVDFSIPFFRDGTRILAFRETLRTHPDPKDMLIGVAEGTTTQSILEDALPGIKTKSFPDMDAAFAALGKGEVQGVANIGVILLGLSRKLEPNRSVVLLPRSRPYGNEAMACILPQNDSAWRDLVDKTIVDLMAGLDDYDGTYMAIHDKWFGRDGVMPYPLDRSTRDYLLQMNIWAR
ncbi:MAG: amino acid ABC transporter substrate-binding protein [Rhizobiales bacterium]|nr:amino acid ABC transporter substrate-binding protein [Hyphomicrobiales bacterium]